MTKPTILVTGATGKTGTAIVNMLREQDWPVRALVRRSDARSDRLIKLGAQVVIADLYDPLQLLEAMRGTERAYYCPPFQPYMIQSATAFAWAAGEAKLEAIVGLSQWLASPNHPSLHTRQVWLVEQMFSTLRGIAHVNLNPGYFADNYLRLIDFASLLGLFPVLTGDSRNAPPSNEDIARVAVAVLVDPLRHAGKSYRPTGPKLLSAYDMVAIISRVLGHRVRAIDMPFWMLERAARLQGVPAFDLTSLRHYVEDHKQGAFERGAPTQVVEQLTGRAAEDFEVTAGRYAALPFARRTLVNRMRALRNFSLVPFTRGYNLRKFDRRQLHPTPAHSNLAMDDQSWRAGHGGTASGGASIAGRSGENALDLKRTITSN